MKAQIYHYWHFRLGMTPERKTATVSSNAPDWTLYKNNLNARGKRP